MKRTLACLGSCRVERPRRVVRERDLILFLPISAGADIRTKLLFNRLIHARDNNAAAQKMKDRAHVLLFVLAQD